MPDGYGQPPPPEGANGLAIAGLILAIVLPIPLGLIFSIVGLVRSRAMGGRGKGLAIAGLIICAAWVVIAVVVVVLVAAGRADRDAGGTVVNPGKVSVLSLKIGDCVQLPAGKEFDATDLTAVPCAQSHDGEVYADQDLTLSGSYPGDDAITKATEDACVAAFAGYIGKAYDDSSLEVTYLYPRAKEWTRGDKGITCLVTAASGQVTGSLKGSGR